MKKLIDCNFPVRCNKCNWIGTNLDLKVGFDSESNFALQQPSQVVCPQCFSENITVDSMDNNGSTTDTIP